MNRRLFLPACLFVANAACTSVPQGKSGIDAVTIRNAAAVDSDDTLDKIATAETPKFLGLFRGVVYEYEIFDRFVLQRDLARIERFYRARGFYEARARAGRVIQKNNNHVAVEIVVEEGQPVLVDDLEVVWPENSHVPDDVKLHAFLAAKKRMRLKRAFDEDKYKDAEDALKKEVTDAGYAFAKVTRNADVNLTKHTATVTYTVEPDLPSKFGAITIQGLDPDKEGPLAPEIPEDKVRSTLDIKAGDPYSTADIDSAAAALNDLEVFSSVRVVPQLTDPPPADRTVPLLVTVEPAKLRALRVGGGVEFDEIKADVHGVLGWEDHNFLGNLRDLQVSFKPGVVLYPTRLNNFVAPTRPLLEEKLLISFKQPSFLEARTEGFVRPQFNVYPILVPNYSTDQPVIGYLEPKVELGLDRLFLRRFYVTLAHNVQVEDPFTYINAGVGNTNLTPILLSYPELQTVLDLTDSKQHPHAGIYVSNRFQIAGGIFGGTARDIKVQPEMRGYIPLGRRLTLAMRGMVGFLFPSNWGDFVRGHLNDPVAQNPDGTYNTESGEVRDLEIDLFRGFYSGGPTSNRGYPSRTIGPYTFVPFLNPASVSQQVRNGEACIAQVTAPTSTTTAGGIPQTALCRTPVGGMSIWEASTELRFNLAGPLSVATFCDGSDVAEEVATIRLNHPHVSCGAGGRYDTPVGPLRVDLGYRIQPLQYPSGSPLEPSQQQIGLIFGVPVAISAGIGEAF